jgi:hypothetical protein
MMEFSIDDAIAHAQKIANSNTECEACKEEHRQLVQWLTELKTIKEKQSGGVQQ